MAICAVLVFFISLVVFLRTLAPYVLRLFRKKRQATGSALFVGVLCAVLGGIAGPAMIYDALSSGSVQCAFGKRCHTMFSLASEPSQYWANLYMWCFMSPLALSAGIGALAYLFRKNPAKP
jgi:hypothetical protein